MDGSIDDTIGQGVFLVEKDAQKDGIGSAVIHFGQLEHRCRCMQNRDRTASYHRTHNDRFPQGTRTTLNELF